MVSKPYRLFLCRKEVADMAEVDSLEIKIQSDATKASQSIDTLVEKLKDVSAALGGINTNALSASAKELTGKLSAINGKGFENLNKSAKEATGSVAKISQTASEVAKGLHNKFKDISVEVDFSNPEKELQKFQKQAQTAQNALSRIMMSSSVDKQIGSIERHSISLAQANKGISILQKHISELSKSNPKFEPNITGTENVTKYLVEYKKELVDFKSSIKSIMDSVGGISDAPKEIFVVPIKNLKQSIEELKQDFPQATNVISEFEKELTNLESIYEKVSNKTVAPKLETGGAKSSKTAAEEVEAIYQKMYGDAEKAGQKTDSLGNKVESLKAKLKELSGQGLNFGDTEFDETYKKLNRASEELKKHKNNLEQAGNSGKSFSEKMKNALANVNSQTNRTSGSMGKLASSIKNALRSVKQSSDGFGGFAKKIGVLYAKIYVLRRGFNALSGTVKSSMDYIENLNYFNAAFGQVAKKADLKSFKEMGYDSAEAYYNSFSQRAEQLTQKRSGFKIEESGMAVSTGEKSLGIDPSLLMNYQAMFAQMSNSMGIASETATKLSSVFTRLGGDIASLKNEDFQKVWQNMASGMTGMSRAVDKYGINIREANLQQTLNNIGIDKNISKLTQQEKVLLRTIVMVDSSRAAWGDLAKTMNQPANQLRLLQSNWSNLSRTIGNIFLPIVAKVLPYINAVTIMLQRFAEQIVKLLGFKDFDWGGLGATGGADIDLDFGDAEDSTAGMADNMDKTSKKAKKAVDNIQGFDILNKLQEPDKDKDKDKDSGKGLSPSETAKLGGALGKLLDEYDKAWNKAFKGMENKANELANKMQKALVNAWKKGDFSELGKKVAEWINKGLAKIPWDKIKKNTKKIASSIATFLNGFINELDWSLIGDTFADGINTIIEGGYEFWTKFDFLKFGKSLSEGVNSFIKKFDAKKFGKLLGAKLRGVIQFAFGFISDLNFGELGKKFGDAINGFFEDMGEVRPNTGLTGWQELGQTISKSITGILDTINTALSTVKWEEVGKAIGQFIGSINWGEIFVKTGTVIVNALWSEVKIAMSAISEDPAGIAKAVLSIFGAVFAYKKLSSLISPLKGNIGLLLSTAIKESKIAGAVKELGSVFAGTLKNTIMSSGIAQTIISVFSGVAGKIKAIGATIGTKLMTGFKAILSNPTTGLIAIAAAAAVAAGLAIADRINEAIDAINFTGDYEFKVPEGFIKAAEDAKKAFENTKKSVDATKKSINEINNAGKEVDGKNIQDLADKYFALSKKTNRSATETAVMKKYSEQLSNAIPGFSENINKQTGEFKGSKEKLDGLVLSLQRAAKAQAAYNASVELYERLQENKQNTQEKEKEVKQLEKEYNMQLKILETTGKRFGKESHEYQSQLRIVGTYATKVNNAREEVRLLKEEESSISSQIKKNNKIMENAEVSTEKYANANKTLKHKMDKLNVSTNSQKDVIKKLNEEVDAGEISWKDYKKLTDGNYKTTKELNDAIKKLSPKSVKVTVKTKGKDDVDNIKTSVNELKDKDIIVNANANTTSFKNAMSLIPTFKDVVLRTDSKSLINNINEKMKITTKISNVFFTKNAKNSISSALEVGLKVKQIELPKALLQAGEAGASVGISVLKGLGKNKAIKWYATGGVLEEGPFYMNRGEIAGKFSNGKSVVANNQQITDGIAQAVGPAVYTAVKQAMSEYGNAGGETVINLDGKEIARSTIRQINTETRQKGVNPVLRYT